MSLVYDQLPTTGIAIIAININEYRSLEINSAGRLSYVISKNISGYYLISVSVQLSQSFEMLWRSCFSLISLSIFKFVRTLIAFIFELYNFYYFVAVYSLRMKFCFSSHDQGKTENARFYKGCAFNPIWISLTDTIEIQLFVYVNV